MKILLLLLAVFTARASFAQSQDEKDQVYQAYFREAELFGYDSTYHKRIKTVVIAPMLAKQLDFDAEYLRDYLVGNILSNKTYIEYVLPRKGTPESWLNLWPRDFGNEVAKDRPRGEMLLALDSALKKPQEIPHFAKTDQRFIVVSEAEAAYATSWKKFYRKYTHCYGLLRLSDVVFSAQGTRAAFHLQESREGLDGWGGVIYMRKTPAGWELESHLQFWIS